MLGDATHPLSALPPPRPVVLHLCATPLYAVMRKVEEELATAPPPSKAAAPEQELAKGAATVEQRLLLEPGRIHGKTDRPAFATGGRRAILCLRFDRWRWSEQPPMARSISFAPAASHNLLQARSAGVWRCSVPGDCCAVIWSNQWWHLSLTRDPVGNFGANARIQELRSSWPTVCVNRRSAEREEWCWRRNQEERREKGGQKGFPLTDMVHM